DRASLKPRSCSWHAVGCRGRCLDQRSQAFVTSRGTNRQTGRIASKCENRAIQMCTRSSGLSCRGKEAGTTVVPILEVSRNAPSASDSARSTGAQSRPWQHSGGYHSWAATGDRDGGNNAGPSASAGHVAYSDEQTVRVRPTQSRAWDLPSSPAGDPETPQSRRAAAGDPLWVAARTAARALGAAGSGRGGDVSYLDRWRPSPGC